ncbi:MAG: pilus assembly protein N-terminal domain-containing protein, partial [Phycisphaeraceae bacterium]
MTLLVAGALGWMPLGSAAAQEAQPDQPQQQPEAAPIEAQIGDGEVEQMTLGLGRSTLIRAPWRVRQVSVASSDIADVQVINPQQVLVVARSVGATDLFLWGENDELEHRRVLVEVDLTSLKQQVARLLPGADVELSQANETVMITGSLRRAEHAEQLNRYMETVGVRFVDMTRVPGVQQVMIQVRVAEASRSGLGLTYGAFLR